MLPLVGWRLEWNAGAMTAIRTLLLSALAAALLAPRAHASGPEASPPVYLLSYDHGGLILWGTDHFRRGLRSAMAWL